MASSALSRAERNGAKQSPSSVLGWVQLGARTLCSAVCRCVLWIPAHCHSWDVASMLPSPKRSPRDVPWDILSVTGYFPAPCEGAGTGMFWVSSAGKVQVGSAATPQASSKAKCYPEHPDTARALKITENRRCSAWDSLQGSILQGRSVPSHSFGSQLLPACQVPTCPWNPKSAGGKLNSRQQRVSSGFWMLNQHKDVHTKSPSYVITFAF